MNYYDEHQSTLSIYFIAKHFDLPVPTIKSFWRTGENIRNCLDKRKRVLKAEHPGLEEEYVRFTHLLRTTGMSVTGSVITKKVKSLRSKYNIDDDKFKFRHG